MIYEKSLKYQTPELMAMMMGPNPLKLCEELLQDNRIPSGGYVLDLGSGQGLTSVFLAREYGFRVCAADLWSEPESHLPFFESMGLDAGRINPVKADANDLPFERETFDAVVCVDSYNYFGRDPAFLDEKLMPFVKRGAYIYICVPGMVKDCHDDIPEVLLRAWTPEQLDYIHDAAWWRGIVSASRDAQLVGLQEMQGNEEPWADWLRQENEYAVSDRRSMLHGGGAYMNFISIVLRKK